MVTPATVCEKPAYAELITLYVPSGKGAESVALTTCTYHKAQVSFNCTRMVGRLFAGICTTKGMDAESRTSFKHCSVWLVAGAAVST